MGNLWKLLIVLLILALWIFIVARSCNPANPKTTTTDTTTPVDEIVDDTKETDLEDLYEVDESDVESGDADASAANTGSSSGNTASGETQTYDDEELEDTPASSTTTSKSSGSTFGNYLVVTGSYLSEANAKIMAKDLKKMGYNGAEVIVFDLSQYYSVTSGRYAELSEARRVARNIKAKGIPAYVHKMRGKKVSG